MKKIFKVPSKLASTTQTCNDSWNFYPVFHTTSNPARAAPSATPTSSPHPATPHPACLRPSRQRIEPLHQSGWDCWYLFGSCGTLCSVYLRVLRGQFDRYGRCVFFVPTDADNVFKHRNSDTAGLGAHGYATLSRLPQLFAERDRADVRPRVRPDHREVSCSGGVLGALVPRKMCTVQGGPPLISADFSEFRLRWPILNVDYFCTSPQPPPPALLPALTPPSSLFPTRQSSTPLLPRPTVPLTASLHPSIRHRLRLAG